MKYNMKRKQFHLSAKEESILYRIASEQQLSEAEIVRQAIQNLEREKTHHSSYANSLVRMAEDAARHQRDEKKTLAPYSDNHDEALVEIIEHEK